MGAAEACRPGRGGLLVQGHIEHFAGTDAADRGGIGTRRTIMPVDKSELPTAQKF